MKKKKTKKQNQEKQLRSSSRALGVRELKSSPAPYFFLSLSKERPLNSPIALPPFLVGTVLFRCFQSVCPHQSSIPQCLTDVPLLQIQKDITEKTKKGRTAKATSHISFLAAQMELEKHVTCFFIIGLCFKQHSNRWINSSKLGLCITELYICFSKSVIGLRFWWLLIIITVHQVRIK